MKSAGPILTVVVALVAIWYAAAVWMNAPWTYDQAARAGLPAPSLIEVARDAMVQKRPVLPPPHQVLVELKKTVIDIAITSKRSLVYHSGITLLATLTGFLTGTIVASVLRLSWCAAG